MRRRKLWLLAIVVLLCVIGTACKKEEKYVAVPVQEVCNAYSHENVIAYTIDAEGSMYCLERMEGNDGAGDFVRLVKADKDGAVVMERPIECIKASGLTAIAVKDNLLYFTGQGIDQEKKGVCVYLYSYHLDTEEVSFIQSFRYFEYIDRILVNERRIYLLGRNRFRGPVGTSSAYSYNGEKLMWYEPDTKEISMMAFEEPMDMALMEDGTPVFYVHTEEGFYLLRYNEEQDTAQVLAKTTDYRMRYFALSNQGESMVYVSSGRGLVLSEVSDWMTESELYPDAAFFAEVFCINGWAACTAESNHCVDIVWFPLDKVQKKTETLRYLSVGYELGTPYGCGYKIERKNFSLQEMDKFALKLLAQDKDYDLCLVDTADAISYNLRENAVFYPLNDIPGIEEYLDACFPYVREAATDEDGVIWMLPIEVTIPGLVMNQDDANKYGFTNNMSFEDFTTVLSALPEEALKRMQTPASSFAHELLTQCLAQHKSVDTEEFRETLIRLSQSEESLAQGNTSSGGAGNLYEYIGIAEFYHAVFVEEIENRIVYSVPKLNAEDKNYGTCLFLAVNPESDRLEATLQYLADWIAYTMKQPEKPLFFADRVVGEDAYEASLYELYQNGEIVFSIDSEIYEGYDAVLSDVSKLEEYIAETERKLKIYMGE